ncbi:DUF4192 family protein [Planotetraspora sp. GP83]|uniref:DUF4192 family protein n=1 Tax=Planotetraspora sp. GP83 TaxID=3156264 RepID=UPI0035160115
MTISLSVVRGHRDALTARIAADPDRAAAGLVRDGLDLLSRFHTGDDLPGDDAARLALALHVLYVRDTAVAAISGDNAAERAERWMAFTARVPEVFLAPPAFLAGHACTLSGDVLGVRAALDMLQVCHPDYRAGLLLKSAVGHGMEPLDLSDVVLPPAEPDAGWLGELRQRLDLFDRAGFAPSAD